MALARGAAHLDSKVVGVGGVELREEYFEITEDRAAEVWVRTDDANRESITEDLCVNWFQFPAGG